MTNQPAVGVRVGRPIDVGDVLSKSVDLIRRYPALLIPQAIVLVISLAADLTGSAPLGLLSFGLLNLVLLIASLIVGIIITGTYPTVIQEALQGRPISISEGFRQASAKFWSLVVAGIVVGILVIIGFIAIIVPGIIFITWYAYTVPAIMLENKGALEGMSASKAFGRDKKLSTFLIFLVFIVVSIIVSAIGGGISIFSPLAGRIVGSILSMPVDAWFAVVITYTYIAYGPSSTPPSGPEILVPGVIPPPPPIPGQPAQPMGPAGTYAARFCVNCGAPIQPDAKFCDNCGRPVG